jgi:glycosyltransferase involved in cell wall biosynthesis
MKIRLLSQNPFSVWFWWIEMQAQQYINCIKKMHPEIDIWFFDWTETDIDIFHVLWLHWWVNPYWIDVLKSKWTKIVLSSVFYLKPNYFLDFRRPWIYRLCSHIPHHITNWMKLLVRNADIILPNSTDEWNQLIQVFWANKNIIKVLHNWVLKDYYNWVSKDLFRNKFGLEKYILCCSHIEPRKNHLYLIEWFLKYKELNPGSDLKLVILGQYRWNYFSYHEKIKKLISSSKDILHIDNLKNTDELFKSAYLWCSAHYLLSSLETPWLSNIEAWLVGKKLVLWDCKPVREYFKWYADYVNPHKLNQIVESIKKLDLNNDNNEESKFILENYTREKISENLLDIYKNLWKTK